MMVLAALFIKGGNFFARFSCSAKTPTWLFSVQRGSQSERKLSFDAGISCRGEIWGEAVHLAE